jgi:asparagine synthase (glutamine-hydrolysing)
MCGITGFIDFKASLKKDSLHSMLDTLHHRGPDDAGEEIFETRYGTVGLAMKRLAILDLSPLGHQPMSFKNLRIIFNGEIYNFKEIKKELEAQHYSFVSGSDTEVILKAYDAWGIDCVKKFIGMFAIVLFDSAAEEVIIIRDRAGVKPLYLYNNGDGLLLFSSELKTFHACSRFQAEVDPVALGQYFNYGYIPAPYAIFKNTTKVKPGHYVKIVLHSAIVTEHCYWDVVDFYNKPKLNVSFQEAVEQTENILISACNYRMVADVPVGVFLSGGYDSSTVTALLQKHAGQTIRTFSIGFHEDEFNEAVHAKKIAEHLGTEHHEYYCSVNEAKQIIPDLPIIYDEPFGDSSAIPTTLVSKVAVQEVKVALSADAGDEIFAGYGNYVYFLKQHSRLARIPVTMKKILAGIIPTAQVALKPIAHRLYNMDTRIGKLSGLLKTNSPVEFNAIINQYFTESELNELILGYKQGPRKTAFYDSVDIKVNDFINIQLALGYKTFLADDILTKVDRATMSVSLEGREPLLDHRLVEYVSQLPSNYKYHNGTSKYLLKEIAHRYIPKKLLDRPKMGFSIPVEKWLRGDLRHLLDHYLSKESVQRIGILNHQVTDRIYNDFIQGRQFNFAKIWFLLMFQMWAEYWLKNK